MNSGPQEAVWFQKAVSPKKSTGTYRKPALGCVIAKMAHNLSTKLARKKKGKKKKRNGDSKDSCNSKF